MQNDIEHNIYIDSCGLHRAGKHDIAEKILAEKYPNVTATEILNAAELGKTLNNELWNLADLFYDKKITEEAFLAKVIAICPYLSNSQAKGLFQRALYDAR